MPVERAKLLAVAFAFQEEEVSTALDWMGSFLLPQAFNWQHLVESRRAGKQFEGLFALLACSQRKSKEVASYCIPLWIEDRPMEWWNWKDKGCCRPCSEAKRSLRHRWHNLIDLGDSSDSSSGSVVDDRTISQKPSNANLWGALNWFRGVCPYRQVAAKAAASQWVCRWNDLPATCQETRTGFLEACAGFRKVRDRE